MTKKIQQLINSADIQIPEVKLSYSHKVKPSEPITTSAEAQKLIRQLYYPETFELQEQFIIVLLNRANKIIGHYKVSTGGITGTVADPRLICMVAILSGCCSIILTHNHPSGSLKPSAADEEITRKIKNAALNSDIKVLDHMILTTDGYFSFADEGLI